MGAHGPRGGPAVGRERLNRAVSFTTGSFTTGGPSRGGVTVSRAADLPGPPTLRFVAPGSVTAGRYGLFEYAMGPGSPGPGPHVHRMD